MTVDTGDRVTVNSQLIPDDWPAAGVIAQASEEILLVLLDNWQWQEFPPEQATLAPPETRTKCQREGGDTRYYRDMDMTTTPQVSDRCAAGEHSNCGASFPAYQDDTCRICTCECHASVTGSCLQGHHNSTEQITHGGCRGWIVRHCGVPVRFVDDPGRVDPAHRHIVIPCGCDCHQDGRPLLADVMAERSAQDREYYARMGLR
jgi:hypothetical protein